jgi:hypothetical protein
MNIVELSRTSFRIAERPYLDGAFPKAAFFASRKKRRPSLTAFFHFKAHQR